MTARPPLRNRVTPMGDIAAVTERGLFTGNRGIIHDPRAVLVQTGSTDMRVPDALYTCQARSTAFQTAGAVRR